MLSFRLMDLQGAVWILNQPLRYEWEDERDTPVPGLEVTFTAREPWPEMREISAFLGEELVFRGAVDEQASSLSRDGCRIRLFARGLGAALLDHEARPQTYYAPASEEVFRLNGAEWGLQNGLPHRSCPENFTVVKGMSHWEVMERFVRGLGGTPIYVDSQGTMREYGRARGTPLLFSNEKEGIPFSEAELTRERYGEIAQVCYKLEQGKEYQRKLNSTEAHRRGLTARRYLDLSGVPRWQWDAALNQALFGEASPLSLRLRLQPERWFQVNAPAVFFDSRLGAWEGLRIQRVRQWLDETGKHCELWLEKEREEYVVNQTIRKWDSGGGNTAG